MSLRKFPVTAPDGTEFRVTISEEWDDFWGRNMFVSISVRTKFWRFKRVGRRRFFAREGHYDTKSPDYVSMATVAVLEYTEASALKQAAADRFNAWDGRVEV